jgi:integrase
VKWRHPEWKDLGIKEWQTTTVSEHTTAKENEAVADALYYWLKTVRRDYAFDSEPAVKQRGFLRPDQPLQAAKPTGPTFGQVANEVIDLKGHVQERTRKKSRAWVRNHFADWVPMPIAEITDLMFMEKATTLRAGLASWTSHGYLSFAQEVFRRAVRKKYIDADADPTLDFVLGTPRREKEMITLTHDEYALVEKAAISEQMRDMLRFIAWTGCRISEVHALLAGDCNVGPGVRHPSVLIRRAFQYDDDGAREVGLPKGNKVRRISLDPATAAMVAKIKLLKTDEDFLFAGPREGGWYYTYWRSSQWEPTIKRAQMEFGLPATRLLTPHELRHTHASWLLADGVDIRVISERLGHSDPAFTLRVYTHVTQRGNDRLMEVLREWE